MLPVFTREYYHGEHYPDYFKTRHWRELNEQLIDSNPKAKCWICHKKSTLLIHHVSYDNLFAEVYQVDIFILCFDCHTRVHFHRNGDKVPLLTPVLIKRMKLLRATYHLRTFRLGSCINTIFNYLFFHYA